MLGFSPYDGFDIWENRVFKKKKKCFIFANFHHYHYDPKDKSEEDLVFIPTKPPKKYRTATYQGPSLTHSMINGREGNLKKPDISEKARKRLTRELKEIERRIEHNSSILKNVVFTNDSYLLYNLIGWSDESINKAIKRLKDREFKWAKGIEKCIPAANSNHHEKRNTSITSKAIQEIIRQRNELKK